MNKLVYSENGTKEIKELILELNKEIVRFENLRSNALHTVHFYDDRIRERKNIIERLNIKKDDEVDI